MRLFDRWMIKSRICGAQALKKLNNKSGIGTVEMILILVVLIGLVLIFKDKLTSLVGNIFDTIESQSSSV